MITATFSGGSPAFMQCIAATFANVATSSADVTTGSVTDAASTTNWEATGSYAANASVGTPYLVYQAAFSTSPSPGTTFTPGGGYRLGRNSDTISIGEIMSAVDEPLKMTRCGSGTGCVATHRCSTHLLWDALGTQIEQFLAAAKLGDVLYGRYSAPRESFLPAKLAARTETAQ